jgi:hypothetical protein
MLTFFQDEAKDAYIQEVKPALLLVTAGPPPTIDMPPDIVRAHSYVFAGDRSVATSVEFARRRGQAIATRLKATGKVSWDDRLELDGMTAFFQGGAREAYSRETTSALNYLEPSAEELVERHRVKLSAFIDVDRLAAQLSAYVEWHREPYAFIRAVFEEIPSDYEDNVAAAFVARLDEVTLDEFAAAAAGRATLNLLYEALVTGDVSEFQRQQSDRLLKAQGEHLVMGDRQMIFPVRNIGVLKYCSATFRAELLPTGRIKVRYTSVKVTQCDMFKKDLETLPPWSVLREGFELDPNELVFVHLYDEGDVTFPAPAVALVDFSNQIQQKTISTATTAFVLGLTVGAGLLASGPVRALETRVAAGKASKSALWAARGLLWADRVAAFIPAGSMLLNDHRDWIVETFPTVGPAVLNAMDDANRLAGYYGWGRLGFDGLRFISSKVRPAWQAWREKALARESTDVAEQNLIKGVDDELESFLNELDFAAEAKASTPGEAVTYVNEHPGVVKGPAGRRRAQVGDEHEIVEVMDASVPTGIGCEYRSTTVRVQCPTVAGMGIGPPEPAPAAFAPGKAPRTPSEVTEYLRSAGLDESEIISFGGEHAQRLTPAAAGRVARLAEHFSPDELQALGNFLYRHEIVINKELELMLLKVERGRLIETLASLDVVATRASQTATVVGVEGSVRVDVAPPRGPRVKPPSPPKVKEAWELAEEQLGPALKGRYGEEGWRFHERKLAPRAEAGQTLGSTIPEYYHPDLNIAFEAKRLRLDEMGIGPAGQRISTPSQATLDALARAREQLQRRKWAMGDTQQNIVFNVTGQGVRDFMAVGGQIEALLKAQLIDYTHVFLQNGRDLIPIK